MSPFDHPVAYALFGVGFLGACVIVAMFVGILRDAARPRPKNAAPAPEVEPVQGRAVTHCTVPFCDDPVQVFIPVGYGDTWTFCLPHGLPYLTAESAQQRKGGAA